MLYQILEKSARPIWISFVLTFRALISSALEVRVVENYYAWRTKNGFSTHAHIHH